MNLTVLLFLIIFFLFPQTFFGQIDPFYQNCAPIRCGGINIRYPFLIEPIQKHYCGYKGFGITCIKGRPVLNLSGVPYIITTINYQLQLLAVTNFAFLSNSTLSCSTSIQNFTLDPNQFDYFYSPELIFLLQGCKDSILQNASSQNLIKCSDGNSQSSSVLAIYPGKDSVSIKEARRACRNVAMVPYESEFVVGVTGVEEILKRGVLLKWFANNCTMCTDSGGRCGYNQNTTEPQCFCPDRPHHSKCNPHRGFIKHSPKTNKLPIILGSALAISGVIILVGIIILLWSRRTIKQLSDKEKTLDSAKSEVETDSKLYGLPLFSYNGLKDATNNFDSNNELGEGGFGTVYHGKLKDGREVAVKRLYDKSSKRIEQFINEVHILTGLRHKNLVSLYGCTSRHSRELLLVYEYLPNGTVADHLQGDKAYSNLLTWSTRMKIAIETASALSYLHASDIIHRDVKTSNILLDNDFSVKVADFGLSRLFPSFLTHISTVPQGTPGYVAPEYYQCNQLTTKSDVYSFGVVLIELLSSLPAVDIERQGHEMNLSNYAMNRIQCNAFSELIDPKLGVDSDFKIKRMTILVAELAFQCLQQERELRPSIAEVLEELRRIESAYYNVIETEETGRKDILGKAPLRSTKLSPSPTENDAAGLLRNVQPPQPSPDSDDAMVSSEDTRRPQRWPLRVPLPPSRYA